MREKEREREREREGGDWAGRGDGLGTVWALVSEQRQTADVSYHDGGRVSGFPKQLFTPVHSR